jgi:hypothetical protein
MEIATFITSALATIAAAFAAFFAHRSAKETRDAAQAQLMASLFDAWRDPAMLDAALQLVRWKELRGDQFAEVFRRLRIEQNEQVRPIDHARRLVSHHFQKIYSMSKEALLDPRVLRQVADKGQVELYCSMVEPLEAAVRADYDRSSFEYLAALHGVQRAPLPYANPKR